MADLIRELGHAFVCLRNRPAFTIAVIATLAVGVGVTTAISSLVHTVVLAPPPYPEPHRLVQIGRVVDGRTVPILAAADVAELRDGAEGILTLGASRFRDLAVSEAGTTERLRGVIVPGATLGMLGIRPVLGRLPSEADDVPGGPCLTVLSHGVWTDLFEASPDLIGRPVRLDGAPCTVVAVMPEGFAFPAPYYAPGELWLLAGPEGVDWNAESAGFLAFGRIEPGANVVTVQAALDAVASRQEGNARFLAMRWAAPSRDASRERLLILLAAAVLVLVIACTNVVTLQLARNVDRRGELATRVALGASTGRLVRLLVAEGVVLSTAGAAAGLLVATLSLDLIVALRSFFIPRMEEVALNGVAVAVCLGLSLAAGVLTTWIPALGLSRLGTSGTLRRFSRGSSAGRGRRRFGMGLVALETALALVLMAGAGLLLQSYRQLASLDPGFRVDDILSVRLSPAPPRYPDDPALVALYEEVSRRVEGLPGVLDVTLTAVPPGVGAGAQQAFALAGGAASAGAWPRTVWRSVSGSYFRTLGIPLLRGEAFEERRGAPRTVVVNEAFVRRYLADGEALGRSLYRVPSPRAEEPEAEAWTIIGVAADAHEEYAHTAVPPSVYVRLEDAPPRSVAILARTDGPPLSLARPLRDAVAAIDPEQPLWGIRDLRFMMRSEYDLNRLGLTLLALFAAAALLLVIAGVYGVVTQSVGQRLREMAIRTALGARGTDVLKLILRDYATFALVGIGAGLGVLAGFGDRLGALSPGWSGLDVRILAVSILIVLSVVLSAALVPSRRATSADPADILQRE